MKKYFLTAIALFATVLGCFAQAPVVEGASYYLPKTALKFSLLIEKTTFTPGEMADYSIRLFQQNEDVLYPKTSYRILSMRMDPVGVPDEKKHYTALVNPKMSIQKVYSNNDGIIMAVNTEPTVSYDVAKPFVAAPKPAPLRARDFMSQEILAAGSKAKMAQLCAKEIYNIRDARNELTRGQAETMPKDGEQLRLMMASMDQQERALTELFTGTTVCDTLEEVFVYCNDGEVEKNVLFRFSEFYGFCEANDLSGAPYYISIKDLHRTPEDTRTEKEKMKQKDDTGLYINVPGQAHVSIYQQERLWVERDFTYAQFGRVENLGTGLFNKKLETTYEVVPTTGQMINMKSEMATK